MPLPPPHASHMRYSVEDLYLKLAGTQVLSWHAQSGALQLLLQLAGGGESDALHSIAAYRPLQVPKVGRAS